MDCTDSFACWIVRVNKILIGNKSDCDKQRAVSKEEGEKLGSATTFTSSKTSAKHGVNVDESFYCIAKEVKDRLMSVSTETVQTKNVSLREAREQQGSCC